MTNTWRTDLHAFSMAFEEYLISNFNQLEKKELLKLRIGDSKSHFNCVIEVYELNLYETKFYLVLSTVYTYYTHQLYAKVFTSLSEFDQFMLNVKNYLNDVVKLCDFIVKSMRRVDVNVEIEV